MNKWNATMPRQKPEAGKANVVFAYRMQNGRRMEFDGKLSAEDAQVLMLEVIRLSKKTKDPA